MTKSHCIRARAVKISSTMPSAKYSCSGSPPMFSNTKTAIDQAAPIRVLERRCYRCAEAVQCFSVGFASILKSDIELVPDLSLGVISDTNASPFD